WRNDLPTPTEYPSTNRVIEFRDVEKRFGDKTILNNLNFTVDRGERVTLIGPSGSGKTTILRLIMTLDTLTGGYIYIDGQPLVYEQRGDKRLPVSKRQKNQLGTAMGLAVNNSNLLPNMTLMEIIMITPFHCLGK